MKKIILFVSVIVGLQIFIILYFLQDILTDFRITKCDLTRTTSKDKDLYVELIVNKSVLCKRDNKIIEIKINSLGFRDREFSQDKPINTTRIIALGDSFTYGWGVSFEDSWPQQLEKLLVTKYGNEFEVLNLGVPGYDIWNMANLLIKKGLKFEPDVILISFIGNDIVPENEREFTNEYVNNPTYIKSFINKSFSLIRSNFNGNIVLVQWPLAYERELKELSNQYRINVCKIELDYEKFRNQDLKLMDGHPNEMQYREVAKIVDNCLLIKI